ncbi:MAG: murein L,D-transpeptidase [Sphingomonas bacterium]|uniref:L,D-transpeptidase family protein n=1 Tax=Sphingomonas bacterium TaxID=1895847 RepID=UPI00262C7FC7|nr:L,D-transpeptidase family protein [Sphingomonas bacterium]MDB5696672.1 murein L,D-transpeptidase [Sphingomonas bacterium]
MSFALSRRTILRGAGSAALLAALASPSFAQAAPGGWEAAIRAAVRGDREIARFYEDRGYRPLWLDDGRVGAEAEQLHRLLVTAAADGLAPGAYRPDAIVEAVERADTGSARELARAEALLSTTFANYVRDVRRHRDMGVVYTEAHFVPIVPSRTAILTSAAQAPGLQRYLETIGWMNPLYAKLRGALASYGEQQDGPIEHVPAGPILRPGSNDPRVRLLRLRLGLTPDGSYDAAVASAVRSLQRSHGQPADGTAGPLTLALLNQGSAETGALLRLNLERARALPAQLGRRYVLVDAAAARLWMYQDDQAVGSMRVAVGRPTEPTPMMAAMIRHLTLNPYWNVPPDLARSRIAPGVVRGGPQHLRDLRYEVLSDWTEGAAKVEPASIDWQAVVDGRREVRLRQLPGAGNSMGRMKFMFPNQLGIYLHDTPDRSLLREEARLVSAGCVRLDDAPQLARWLFGRVPVARGSTPEQRLDLPEPVPVYITYLTAAPEPHGVALRPDVYGRDPAQLAALARSAGQRRRRY